MSTIEIDSDGTVTGSDGLEQQIDAGMVADIRKFERSLAGYLAGEIEEDVFKVFRLANGIYGQRQGGQLLPRSSMRLPIFPRSTAEPGDTSRLGKMCSFTLLT